MRHIRAACSNRQSKVGHRPGTGNSDDHASDSQVRVLEVKQCKVKHVQYVLYVLHVFYVLYVHYVDICT